MEKLIEISIVTFEVGMITIDLEILNIYFIYVEVKSSINIMNLSEVRLLQYLTFLAVGLGLKLGLVEGEVSLSLVC